MSNRWWGAVLTLGLACALSPCGRAEPPDLPPPARPQAGFLVLPVSEARSNLQVVPYYPQAGDMLLCDYFKPLHTWAFEKIGSGAPVHSAIVFDRPDGTPAILDITGPTTLNAHVQLLEVWPRLAAYPGAILVRRPRQPLTPEQSATLTQFALAQEGKRFAVARLALQGTPFRPRTCRWWARTCLDRKCWICSELVAAAATVAGLLDPAQHFTNVLYPRDLAYDECFDLSASFQDSVLWVADPHPTIQGNHVWFSSCRMGRPTHK